MGYRFRLSSGFRRVAIYTSAIAAGGQTLMLGDDPYQKARWIGAQVFLFALCSILATPSRITAWVSRLMAPILLVGLFTPFPEFLNEILFVSVIGWASVLALTFIDHDKPIAPVKLRPKPDVVDTPIVAEAVPPTPSSVS
jgi:hypothetical protein